MVVGVFKQDPLFAFFGIMRIGVCDQAFDNAVVVQYNSQVVDVTERGRQDTAPDDFFLVAIHVHPFIIMCTIQIVPRLIIHCRNENVTIANHTAESHRMKNQIVTEYELKDVRFTQKLDQLLPNQLLNK